MVAGGDLPAAVELPPPPPGYKRRRSSGDFGPALLGDRLHELAWEFARRWQRPLLAVVYAVLVGSTLVYRKYVHE